MKHTFSNTAALIASTCLTVVVVCMLAAIISIGSPPGALVGLGLLVVALALLVRVGVLRKRVEQQGRS